MYWMVYWHAKIYNIAINTFWIHIIFIVMKYQNVSKLHCSVRSLSWSRSDSNRTRRATGSGKLCLRCNVQLGRCVLRLCYPPRRRVWVEGSLASWEMAVCLKLIDQNCRRVVNICDSLIERRWPTQEGTSVCVCDTGELIKD